MITVLAVGKKHEAWVRLGIERYQERLKAPFTAKWELLAHSSLSDNQARVEESARILKRLSPADFVVLLDERGQHYDSPALSRLLEERLNASIHVVLIIGGAYGVDETVHDRANVVLSLSEFVFPHQLVRLVLIEQLYRAQEIARGGKYHHE